MRYRCIRHCDQFARRVGLVQVDLQRFCKVRHGPGGIARFARAEQKRAVPAGALERRRIGSNLRLNLESTRPDCMPSPIPSRSVAYPRNSVTAGTAAAEAREYRQDPQPPEHVHAEELPEALPMASRAR